MTKSKGTEEAPHTTDPDFGTPEARRQAFHIIEQPDPQDRTTRRVRVTDTIDWYLRRDYITQVQADALRKWQNDAHLAGILPSCIGSYGQNIFGAAIEITETRMAAQARRNNAVAFFATHKINQKMAVNLIDAVAVQGKSAGRWWMEHMGGGANEALDTLQKLTNGLVRHYGLEK